MRFFSNVDIIGGKATLDDGEVVPIIGYYDHSGDGVEVPKYRATQVVVGDEDVGYFCIQLVGFNIPTIH